MVFLQHGFIPKRVVRKFLEEHSGTLDETRGSPRMLVKLSESETGNHFSLPS